MDKDEQPVGIDFDYWTKNPPKDLKEPRLPTPDSSILGGLIKERKEQRQLLLRFVMYLTVASFYLLAGIVIVQMWYRVLFNDKTFSILSGYELETLSVAVFGEVIGIIYTIASSLWDDEDYINKLNL